MIKIKNIGKRLITFAHGDEKFPLPCGLDNERIVPDAVVETVLFKAFEKEGEVVNCGSVDEPVVEDEELKASERYIELKLLKVGELRTMAKDMYEITGVSRMKEYELIKAIIEAETE